MTPDVIPTIHRFATVSSTQRVARDLLREGKARVGDVVVGDAQSDGRGRLGRFWLSPCGSLYATFLVDHDELLSLRAGVAAATALRALGADVRLKWPNDLVVEDRKLGGILIESDGSIARVGIGVNLMASPLAGATSLADLGLSGDRDSIVCAIFAELSAAQASAQVLRRYRELSTTFGRRVRIDMGDGQSFDGRAIDIDAGGRLIVDTGRGVRVVASGDCLHANVIGPASS